MSSESILLFPIIANIVSHKHPLPYLRPLLAPHYVSRRLGEGLRVKELSVCCVLRLGGSAVTLLSFLP